MSVKENANKILEADDKEALDLEKKLLEQTDNGWKEGDPIEQPPQGVEDE